MRTPAVLCLLVLAMAGCTTTRESNPPRTATEQLLISAAVDRAVAGLHLDIPKGARVYVDASNFEGYDSKYAVGSIALRFAHGCSPGAPASPHLGRPPDRR